MSIFSSSELSFSNEAKQEDDDEEGKKQDGGKNEDKDEIDAEQENVLIKYATPPTKPKYFSRLRSSLRNENRRSQRVMNKTTNDIKLRSRLRLAKNNKADNQNENEIEEEIRGKTSLQQTIRKKPSHPKSVQKEELDNESASFLSSDNASDDDYSFESEEDEDDDYNLKKNKAQTRCHKNRVSMEISRKKTEYEKGNKSLPEKKEKINKVNPKSKMRSRTTRTHERNGDDDKYNPDDNNSSSSDNYLPSNSSDSSLEIARPRKRTSRNNQSHTNQELDEEIEFDDDMSSSSKESLTIAQLGEKKSPRKLSLQFIVACPSKIDAITQLPLNDVHVCWISPDKRSRQCFNLETLKKVALSSSICIPVTTYSSDSNNFIGNPFNASSKDYLQPPHFRTIMCSEMKDQIVSKFGRQALQLQSFDDKKETSLRNPILPYESPGYDFNDRLNQYIRSQMGSSDIYCCPLCYIEADRRVRIQDTANLRHRNVQNEDSDTEFNDINSDSDNEHLFKDVDFFTFVNDPMYILESFDDEFSTAASFCFRKVVDVKRHVRKIHNLDTGVLDGNELFHQFRIRASDGLLQRYLKSLTQQSYWAEGHSFDYMHLLHMISMHSEIGPTINPQAYEFSESFPNRAQKLWEYISAPFLKLVEGELDDFEVSDVDSVESNVESHMVRHLPLSDEGSDKDPHEIMVKVLRAKRGVCESDNSVSNASGCSNYTAEPDEVEYISQFHSEESEEEDEWMQSKRYKSRNKSQHNNKRLVKESLSLTNLSTNKSTSSASSAEIQACSSQGKQKILDDETTLMMSSHSHKRKRIVCESSDDDDE